ncbi:MAG: response regulator transcription factor [Candidatus Dormibacteria bacterium]
MPSPAPSRPRVLLVDDDPRLLHIVSLYLQVQDLEVSTAGDGEQALQMLSRGFPELLISDVMMPFIDGLTLCRRVRALPGGSRLPIIVFTALDGDSDQQAALAAGADRVITKPFNLPGLGDAVAALLGRVPAA